MNYYVGIDIGGTNIKYGLVAEDGRLISHNKVATNSKGSEIIREIQWIVTNYQCDYEIRAVGVSVPGVVTDNGYLATGGSIPDFYDLDLKQTLTELIGLPVYIENDANSAALAEKWLGSGKEYQHILCVVIGTGIGGAIIINGELFRGAHSNAGEFGFMVVEPIKNRDTRMATLSMQASVSCGLIWPYQEQSPDHLELNGEQIFQLASEGDVLAMELLEAFYQRLALGIFNMGISFDPEIVLIGGAISSNSAFIEELSRRVETLKKDHVDMGNVQLPKIDSCYFYNQAGIIGSVYRAITGLAKEQK